MGIEQPQANVKGGAMIQIADLTEYTEADIPKLVDKIKPVLEKRRRLHEKYTRKASDTQVMWSHGNEEKIVTKLPFEKFITDLATGYTAGKPRYTVNDSKDEEKNRLIEELLDKQSKDDDYSKGMEILIEYITNYNDDDTENYDLIHDIFELTSCYEVIYENEDNEIVYAKYDPLQTVATWDYDIPANLTGLVRLWEEKNAIGTVTQKCEVTDVNGSRTYIVGKETAEEIVEQRLNTNWGDVPAIAVETDMSIFETCEDVISAYEQLVQNARNTYQYNDSDCKLKIVNYQPQNPMTTTNEQGDVVVNQARIEEDNMWIKSRTIYVGEGGDVTWLSKPVDANGVQTMLKIYIDLIFQLAGIPNTSDLAFNSADLNASAIDRKFYVMNMNTENIVAQLKKAYLRRWELIFNRINLKKGTSFDFRDIQIEIPKNLPANDVELIDEMLKLNGLISQQTIVEKLGYNYLSEKEKMDQETESNMIQNIERMQMLQQNGINPATNEPIEEEETKTVEENEEL